MLLSLLLSKPPRRLAAISSPRHANEAHSRTSQSCADRRPGRREFRSLVLSGRVLSGQALGGRALGALLLGILLIAASAAPAQSSTIGRDGVEQVRDLNLGFSPVGSLQAFDPLFRGVELNGNFYYPARIPGVGNELWRSDGTSNGTELAVDLCPGSCSGEPQELTLFGDTLVLSALTPDARRAIWILDDEGPRPLPGAPVGPSTIAVPPPFSFVQWQGRLYFLATENNRQFLYSWVGGDELAQQITEVSSGTRTALFAADDQLFFYADTFPATGRVYLWRSDGTAAGTVPIFDTCDGISCIVYPDSQVVRNKIYFVTSRPGVGFEMWSSDGTVAGTETVEDICPGSCSGFDFNLFLGTYNSELYFAGRPVPTEHRLYALSDSGSLRTIPGAAFPLLNIDRTAAVHDGRLFFSGWTQAHGAALWSTDGSTMRQEVDAFDGLGGGVFPSTVGWIPRFLTSTPTGLYFVISVSNELWRFDGSDGQEVIGPEVRANLSAFNGGIVFPADDGNSGGELWRADGGAASLVQDALQAPASSNPALFTAYDDGIVFQSTNITGVDELWYSDGTADGTVPFAPEASAETRELFHYENAPGGPALLWAGTSSGPDQPRGLWIANGDGPSGGDAMRIREDFIDALEFHPLPDGRVLFNGYGIEPGFIGTGYEPWITDGTADGTQLLANLADDRIPTLFDPPGPLSSFPQSLVDFQGSVAFIASTALAIEGDFGLEGEFFGRELHMTDLTGAGTAMVEDLCPGSCTSYPDELTVAGDHLYFTANSEGDGGVEGRQLWVLDSPSSTPRRVFTDSDLVDGQRIVEPQGLWRKGDELIFIARVDRQHLHAVYRTDGTADGTRVVKYITVIGLGREVDNEEFARTDEHLFFVASRNAGAQDPDAEVWVTDGTANGTRLLRTLVRGIASAYPRKLTALDERRIAFEADAEGTGPEPWISDGTAAGTRRLGDLVDGAEGSFPEGFTLGENGQLFFSAVTEGAGREPWVGRLVRPQRPCDAAAGLCLLDDRMEVRVRWHDFRSGRTGRGTPIPVSGSDRSGFFSFFREGNLELAVKALDATNINGNAWYFSSSLTDLEYWIEVEDLNTRTVRHYYNPPRDTCGIADDRSLPWADDGSFGSALTADPLAAALALPADRREVSEAISQKVGSCTPDETTLCLAEGRYALTMRYFNDGTSDLAKVVTQGDSAWFWFFKPDNLEAVVKLLDARDVNGHYWFFASPLTTLRTDIRIHDTVSGQDAFYGFRNQSITGPCAIVDLQSPFFAATPDP